jgi:hypothetical protein
MLGREEVRPSPDDRNPKKKPPEAAALRDGSDGTRTRDLRRDRPAL